MAEVVHWNGITRLDTSPQNILDRAAEAGLASVVVIGSKSDGSEFFAASMADGGDAIWHLERAKLKLLLVPDMD